LSVKRTKKYNQYIDFVLKGKSTEALRITADATSAQIKALCPVKLGTLRRSIKVVPQGKEYSVQSKLPYALFVEFGTRAHTIVAKFAKVLTNGIKFFGKKVNHPGTRAQPFFRPAAILVKRKIAKIWREAFNGYKL